MKTKVVLVGAAHTGKTSIANRFVYGEFSPHTIPTIQPAFFQKTIASGGQELILEIWDTAGQELFRSVTRGYYRGSAGAFIIFDLTNRDTFDHVGRWLHDVKEVARSDVVTVLIGNKVDRVDDRDVTREEAEKLAQANKMLYFETSAKTGEQLDEAVNGIVAAIEQYVADGVYEFTPNPSPQQFLEPEPEKSSCSC